MAAHRAAYFIGFQIRGSTARLSRILTFRFYQQSETTDLRRGLLLTGRSLAHAIAEGEPHHSPGWSEALRAQPWVRSIKGTLPEGEPHRIGNWGCRIRNLALALGLRPLMSGKAPPYRRTPPQLPREALPRAQERGQATLPDCDFMTLSLPSITFENTRVVSSTPTTFQSGRVACPRS